MRKTIQSQIWNEKLNTKEKQTLCTHYYKNKEIGNIVGKRIWIRLDTRLKEFINNKITTAATKELQTYTQKLTKKEEHENR